MKERIFTTKEQGRGRGAVNISWGYEASSYIGANWYIITYKTSPPDEYEYVYP